MNPQPSLGIFSQEYFMKQAYRQALLASEEGEVPVGAVVVSGNKIIAQTYNQVERLNDVTAHAEILALTAASEAIGNKYLMDCTLYVTLEPCLMCAGALRWSQLGKLVFATQDDKNGFMRYGKEILHPQTKVAYGVMEEECKNLLKEFFSKLRK
jgi:tRNA(adenine34) deaminase